MNKNSNQILLYTKFVNEIKIDEEELKLVLCTVLEIRVPPGGGQGGRGDQSFYMEGRGR